jgi:predicted nuclease of predicted toxin-antitoxin system
VRLLVDEDLASRELLRRLEDVLPNGVLPPDRSTTDEQVWDRAQTESAEILTGNAVDFVVLAAASESHHRNLHQIRRSVG